MFHPDSERDNLANAPLSPSVAPWMSSVFAERHRAIHLNGRSATACTSSEHGAGGVKEATTRATGSMLLGLVKRGSKASDSNGDESND